YEFLPILLRESIPHSALPTATAAVGLASLSNTKNSPEWSSMAQSLYGKAIRKVHAAVADPVLQPSDQTLAAIMLLGFYEVGIRQRLLWIITDCVRSSLMAP